MPANELTVAPNAVEVQRAVDRGRRTVWQPGGRAEFERARR